MLVSKLPVCLLLLNEVFQLLNLFFDQNMVDTLSEQSNIYSIVFNKGTVNVLHGKIFRQLLYFSTFQDITTFHNMLYVLATHFNNFFKCLHCANMEINLDDCCCKVRPLFDITDKNFKSVKQFRNLSIDEHIAKYYCRFSTKRFIHGKPIRYGHEIFGIAAPNGFVYHSEPSCGSATEIGGYGLGQGPNIFL